MCNNNVRIRPKADIQVFEIYRKIMSKKEDLHIAILSYGKDNLEAGITLKGLCDHIKNKGYTVDEYRMRSYFDSSYESLDQKYRGIGFDKIPDNVNYALTIESTFRLIEYKEFKSANKNALIATIIAIFAILISIGVGLKQLSTATKINDKQLDKIIQLKYDDSNANKKLEEIIKNQQLQIDNQKEHTKAISRKNATPNQSSTTNTKQ